MPVSTDPKHPCKMTTLFEDGNCSAELLYSVWHKNKIICARQSYVNLLTQPQTYT